VEVKKVKLKDKDKCKYLSIPCTIASWLSFI